MDDREKVIRRLAEVSEYTRAKADIAGIGKGKEIFDSFFRAVEDAIALLREQETEHSNLTEIVRCRDCVHAGHLDPNTTEFVDVGAAFSPAGPAREWKCKKCGVTILTSESGDLSKIVFCWNCGRKVQWNG